MVKYVKLIIEDDVDIKHIMPLARQFAKAGLASDCDVTKL